MDGGFFVAQAISLSKACVHVMPARHDQERAPQVDSNHWMPHPQVACKPLALLGEQAEASVAGDTQSPWPGPADRVWQMEDEVRAARPWYHPGFTVRLPCFFPRFCARKTDLVMA